MNAKQVFALMFWVLLAVLPLHAGASHDYPQTGTVLSVTTDQGVVYKIDSGDKIYKMECIKSRMFQATPPQCAIYERPIAVNDTVHFRLDEDEDDTATAYMPASGTHEEKLLVLSTELKALPPLSATPNRSTGQNCAVLSIGMDLVERQYSVGGGISPVMPFGPVTAIPVTGGPPVQVLAAGPVSGGVITGVPATGGPPVTAIPVAPVTGSTGSATSTTMVTESEWVPYLRVQTAEHVYKLACESNPCWVKDQEPQLGDMLTIRIKEKAYLSWLPPGPKGEQKFAILTMDDMNEPAATPSH